MGQKKWKRQVKFVNDLQRCEIVLLPPKGQETSLINIYIFDKITNVLSSLSFLGCLFCLFCLSLSLLSLLSGLSFLSFLLSNPLLVFLLKLLLLLSCHLTFIHFLIVSELDPDLFFSVVSQLFTDGISYQIQYNDIGTDSAQRLDFRDLILSEIYIL